FTSNQAQTDQLHRSAACGRVVDPPMTLPAIQRGPRVELDANRRQCFTLEPTVRPRHTLQRSEAPLGDPSLALSDGCNGFRTRSLKLASKRANRHTLKAAPAAAIVVSESGATGETKKAAQRFSAIGRLTGKPLRHASRWN